MKTNTISLFFFLFIFISSCNKNKETVSPIASATDYTIQTAPTNSTYGLTQAMSDNAQLMTIAFSGLAFITGNEGGDTFFPPGKVADYFGFQYMRDVDEAGYGHNTQFLTRAANNVLKILNTSQKSKLITLAKAQVPLYVKYAYNRLPLMNAFRRNLNNITIPIGTSGLDRDRVIAYSSKLYSIDADLSYQRAIMMGEIVQSLTSDQKTYLANMKFNDFNTWPDVAEDASIKVGMTNNEYVAVMTYASEFFSWYKGGINADIYFCPERHGTYFGGFFLKDYPAMNNPNYFIPLDQTGECGNAFINALTVDQKALIVGIIPEQKALLTELALVRENICKEMRKAMNGVTLDKTTIYNLIARYGELDGSMSCLYAMKFGEINKTLTTTQLEKLKSIRNLDVIPNGMYRYATAVATPSIPNTDYLFGIGNIPSDAGNTTPPIGFDK